MRATSSMIIPIELKHLLFSYLVLNGQNSCFTMQLNTQFALLNLMN